MEAVIIGATGATGMDVLHLLNMDDYFTKINVFIRGDKPIKADKTTVYSIDFNKPEQWQNSVKGDVLFSCLGTTLKAAGSKKKQWKVDYQYQYEFAKAAKRNGIENYVLISAGFASSKSPFFYSRMKGQLEEDVIKLGFKNTILFKPPILIRKNSNRKAEVLAVKTIHFLNRIGILKSQKPLSTADLAKSMIVAFKTRNHGVNFIKPQEILTYLKD